MIEPIKDLYTFEGQAKIREDENGPIQTVKLDMLQFLHRGAVLKNSDRVLAMVVQTGTQTKLSMNLTKYRIK